MTRRGDPAQIGRLAFREEGERWNAYWAPVETMDGAVFLGSIRMSLIAASPDLRADFVELMKTSMEHVILEAVGGTVDWPEERPAPEHERSGKA